MIAVVWKCRDDSRSDILRELGLWGLSFRIIGILGSPLYEDDFYRYLWDGRQFVETGNPYQRAPAEFLDDPSVSPVFRQILSHVNFPEIPTIYGPIYQVTFAASYLIAPAALWPLKLICLAFDIGIAWLLLRLKVSSAQYVLYAWSPLIVKEISFTAHPDILMAFFALLAAYAASKDRPLAAGSALAMAIGAKVTAVVLLPMLWMRQWKRSLIGCSLGLLALYLPALLGRHEAAGLAAFLRSWEFNSFGYAAVAMATPPDWARPMSFGLAAILLALVWRSWRTPKGDLAALVSTSLGIFFVFSPVVNPWYLVVLAPFNAWHPSRWATVACVTVLISYATGNNLPGSGLPDYNHPDWVRPTELLPVLAALLVDLRKGPLFRNVDRASESESPV